MKTKILADFQICISVPLKTWSWRMEHESSYFKMSLVFTEAAAGGLL